jgi:hypothetical protein
MNSQHDSSYIRISCQQMASPQLPRQFSSKQVRAILKRAANLQIDRDSDRASDGLTLQQLEAAAAEIGIDSSLVRAAAEDVSQGEASAWSRFIFGGPWSVESDQTVTGEFHAEEWADLVEDVRLRIEKTGVVKVSESTYEWESQGSEHVHLSIIPKGPDTRIRLSARYGEMPHFAYFVIPFFSFFIGLAPAMSASKAGHLTPLILLLCLVGIPFAVFSLLRLLFGRFAQRRWRAFTGLANFVNERISRTQPAASHVSLQERNSQSLAVDEHVINQL